MRDNKSWCVCWGRGTPGWWWWWEGGHLLSACVGECRVEGGGMEEVLLFPSAGKQCLEESVLWLVLDSDFFCSASEPRSCCAFPRKKKKKKPRTTHSVTSPVSTTGFLISPTDNCVTNQLKDQDVQVRVCIKKKIPENKVVLKISLMNNFILWLIPVNPSSDSNSIHFTY